MAPPTDGRGQVRRIAAALALIGASSAIAAPIASAAPLTLHVVNTRGVEQASLVSLTSVDCGGPCGTAGTDGNGRLDFDATPGDQVTVTRGAAAPEGAGVAYTVPSPVPAAPVTIELPALPGTVAPGIDSAEAWLLTRVNEERAALGRSALVLSSTLSRAADAYTHYLEETGQFSHTALADPGVRAVDQGWPVPGGSSVGEALALAPSKEFALQGWMQSSSHWTLLMMDGLDSVGVGRAGQRWIMMPAACSLASAKERCGLGWTPPTCRPDPPVGPARRPSAPRGPARPAKPQRSSAPSFASPSATTAGRWSSGYAWPRAAATCGSWCARAAGRPGSTAATAATSIATQRSCPARPLDGHGALRGQRRLDRPPPAGANVPRALNGSAVPGQPAAEKNRSSSGKTPISSSEISPGSLEQIGSRDRGGP